MLDFDVFYHVYSPIDRVVVSNCYTINIIGLNMVFLKLNDE